MTIPTGLVKSTIHASGRRQSSHALCDLEDDGDRAQCLAQPAGTCRLLADAAAGKRDRLVGEARLLAADADLDEHEVGAVDGTVEIVGDEQRAVEPLACQHPAGHPTDDLPAFGVDVVQRQLRHVYPAPLAREAGDELRRIRRAAADDGDLHPFTPVSVTPSTNAFWARKKTAITGSVTRSVAAIVRFHCT